MLVGRVEEKENHWYQLSDGAIVSFHTAFTNKERTKYVIFASDDATWPSITAAKLHIQYFFMRNSTPAEVKEFMLDLGIEGKEVDKSED